MRKLLTYTTIASNPRLSIICKSRVFLHDKPNVSKCFSLNNYLKVGVFQSWLFQYDPDEDLTLKVFGFGDFDLVHQRFHSRQTLLPIRRRQLTHGTIAWNGWEKSYVNKTKDCQVLINKDVCIQPILIANDTNTEWRNSQPRLSGVLDWRFPKKVRQHLRH